MTLEEYLRKELDGLDKEIRSGKFTSLIEFQQELSDMQQKFYARFKEASMRQRSDTWREKTERIVFKAGDYISRQRSDAIQASVSSLEKQNMQLKSEIDLVSQEKGFKTRENEKIIKGLDLRIRELETLLAQSENDKDLALSRMKSDTITSLKDYQI